MKAFRTNALKKLAWFKWCVKLNWLLTGFSNAIKINAYHTASYATMHVV